jgi:hypothetical protein
VSSESKAERERRRRAAELLGDLMPDTTSDESDEGWSEKDEGGTRDDELRRDVPPHHG